MSEFQKNILSETSKQIVALALGAIALYATQKWTNSDLEYIKISRDAYLSTPLGNQGLKLSYDGEELKNISIVEFGIYNRTSREIKNSKLIFSYQDPEKKYKLISGDITTPNGIPKNEIIEESFIKKQQLQIL
ncbi:hypothetical protein ACT51I_19325 [Pseudomonas aeruginosa]